MFNPVPQTYDRTGLQEKPPKEMYRLLMYWLKLNENKRPNRSFAHEPYLKEMIRYSRVPDL